MMNVDVFLMIAAAIDFDGSAVGAPWAVLGPEVLDRVVGYFLVPDVQVNPHRPPAAF